MLVGLEEKATAAEAELAVCTEQITALRRIYDGEFRGIDAQQGQSESLGKREHELSLNKNELSVRIETLIEHTGEELQINLHEAYASYEA